MGGASNFAQCKLASLLTDAAAGKIHNFAMRVENNADFVLRILIGFVCEDFFSDLLAPLLGNRRLSLKSFVWPSAMMNSRQISQGGDVCITWQQPPSFFFLLIVSLVSDSDWDSNSEHSIWHGQLTH